MTLGELIETNIHICEMSVTIRKDGRYVHEYRFGLGARWYPGDEGQPQKTLDGIRHVNVYNGPINYIDIKPKSNQMRGWGTIIKNIPEKLREMEVSHWSLRTAYSGIRGSTYAGSSWSDYQELHVDVKGAFPVYGLPPGDPCPKDLHPEEDESEEEDSE